MCSGRAFRSVFCDTAIGILYGMFPSSCFFGAFLGRVLGGLPPMKLTPGARPLGTHPRNFHQKTLPNKILQRRAFGALIGNTTNALRTRPREIHWTKTRGNNSGGPTESVWSCSSVHRFLLEGLGWKAANKTNAQKQTHIHTHTHTHTHPSPHTHTHTHTLTPPHTHTHTRADLSDKVGKLVDHSRARG